MDIFTAKHFVETTLVMNYKTRIKNIQGYLREKKTNGLLITE
jgi:hypothetical protein